MSNITLIPNIRIRDENGIIHQQAQIAILEVCIQNHWSLKGEKIGDEYKESDTAGGVTYQVAYYGNATVQGQGFPIKQLLDYDGASFSKVLVADIDAPEIKSILDSAATKEQKAVAVVKAALVIRSR